MNDREAFIYTVDTCIMLGMAIALVWLLGMFSMMGPSRKNKKGQ